MSNKQCYVIYSIEGLNIQWFADSSEDADVWIDKQNIPSDYYKCRKDYPMFVKAMEYFKSKNKNGVLQ